MNISNLPTRESGLDIVGKVRKNAQGEFLSYFITDSHEWKITEIMAATPEGIANQIATAIKEARDIGFEQGRAHIRKAIGA
jgi:hypothetical protein